MLTTTVQEHHPRPRHKGAAVVPVQPGARKVGFELATDGIQSESRFYVFCHRLWLDVLRSYRAAIQVCRSHELTLFLDTSHTPDLYGGLTFQAPLDSENRDC